QLRVRPAMPEQFGRNDGAGIEAHRAGGEQLRSAQGDQVGGARSCADEMDGHGSSPLTAMAQVTGPCTLRGPSSRDFWPAAASAAVSETDGVPAADSDAAERVRPRSETSCRAGPSTR